MNMFRDPFYQGPHALWRLWGEEALRTRVEAILARCGVLRTRSEEAAPPPAQLVSLSLPDSPPRRT